MAKKKHFLYLIMAMTLYNSNFCRAQRPESRAGQNPSSSETTIALPTGTDLVFAGVEEGKRRLTTKDDFINSLSPFDRSARLKTDKLVSEKEFLEYIANQVRPWNVDEKNRMKSAFEAVIEKLKPFKLNLPHKIFLIKTTGKEEGEATYCRSGAIVLPQNMVRHRDSGLESMLLHELFHILTANDSKLKETLYEVIHFKKCNDIELPETLSEIKITNPDGPKNDHYIELQYEDSVLHAVPIIYSSAPKYDVEKGGEFFRYLKFNLLAVEKADDRWQCKCIKNSKPILLEIRNVPDYFNKIGRNTGYIIHPEEILADNFVLMVQANQPVKSRWVIERMQKIFMHETEVNRN